VHERQVYDSLFQHNPSACVLKYSQAHHVPPWETLIDGNTRQYTSPAKLISLYHGVPPSSCHHLAKNTSRTSAESSSFQDMNISASASFLLLYNSALQDYTTQTGTNLIDHPFAKQLKKCKSVDSISSLLQENVQRFRKFRTEDGKIMKPLKCAVHVLHKLSTSTVLGEGIGLVRPNAAIPISCS